MKSLGRKKNYMEEKDSLKKELEKKMKSFDLGQTNLQSALG